MKNSAGGAGHSSGKKKKNSRQTLHSSQKLTQNGS